MTLQIFEYLPAKTYCLFQLFDYSVCIMANGTIERKRYCAASDSLIGSALPAVVLNFHMVGSDPYEISRNYIPHPGNASHQTNDSEYACLNILQHLLS